MPGTIPITRAVSINSILYPLRTSDNESRSMRSNPSRREWIIGVSSFAVGAAFPAFGKFVAHAAKGPVSGFDKSLRASVVKITISAPPQGAGSGFCIARGSGGTSIIATASHVVDGSRLKELLAQPGSHTVTSHDGANDPMRPPWCHENWMDVCAFHSELQLRPLPLADELPKIGSPVMVLGFPGGRNYSITEGKFLGLEVDGNCRIKISANAIPGFSGGPILNSKGEVIGMTVTVLADGSASHGVPLHELRNLRERMLFLDEAEASS